MMMRFCAMGEGGDPFDGDEEDDGGGSTKAQGRWEHPAWLADLYNSRRETIKHANGSGANRSSKPFHQMLHGWLPTKTIWSRFYDTRCARQNLKIFDPPFFYWDPLMLLGQPEDQPAGSGLVCDKCQQTESTLKKGVLRRDGFLGRPRRACDLNNSVFLIGVSYRCNNKQCNKRYRSWSPEVLDQLSPSLHSMFSFHLSHRCAITSVAWNLMRGVFQFGLGSKQFANLLVTAHRAAHDRLEVDYRSAILAREADLPSTSLYPALGDWEDPTGNCGHVPNSQVLQEFYDSVMRKQETLLSHAESLKPCKIMTIDHSYKVPKQIAMVEGVPPFIALLMVGNEYGEVRAHVLTTQRATRHSRPRSKR
ncbi:BQ5605_C032g11110 [Microbotryum silenes-dioicae]|uniref:BQ5605_C032g11110 protein n=1 Tax=Microbotryum silenes-dioicae TaxID=796604 RepID=A0A2X0ML63_9BASI|nr:BQ5605_C032g11110 [Microbotryum silenes-dioicae]